MESDSSHEEQSWNGISEEEEDEKSIDLTEALASIKPSSTAINCRLSRSHTPTRMRMRTSSSDCPPRRQTSKPARKYSSPQLPTRRYQELSLAADPSNHSVFTSLPAPPPRDVVGMARTGSGKTLAYLIPLIQALGGIHSVQFGIRALILVPTRELALQVLKVGKDLAKGFIQGDRTHSTSNDSEQTGKAEGLRWGLIVGGDSLEDQFTMFSTNPDVIIATPGRLLHLVVEMNLDLKSVTFVVFDEADRLFEMGFATQLEETLHRLPANRQTLLFSATLPKSLVEFAKAGLQNPKLIRLDSESKISSDLQMAFLS
ncbi:hypothetical protein PCASD_14030, partial [Puccinia coronata f. sp. avenae]